MARARSGQLVIVDWALEAAQRDARAVGRELGTAFLGVVTGRSQPAGSTDSTPRWNPDPTLELARVSVPGHISLLDDACTAWMRTRHLRRHFPACNPEDASSVQSDAAAVLNRAHHSYREQLATVMRRADAFLAYADRRPSRLARSLERSGLLPARDNEVRALGIVVPTAPGAAASVIRDARLSLEQRLAQSTLVSEDFTTRVMRDASTLARFNVVAGVLDLATLRQAQTAVVEIATAQRLIENARTLHTAITQHNELLGHITDRSGELLDQMVAAAVPGHRLAGDLGVRALIGERPVHDAPTDADNWDRAARILMALVQGGVLDNLHDELDPNWPDFSDVLDAVEFARRVAGRASSPNERPRTELSEQLDTIVGARAATAARSPELLR